MISMSPRQHVKMLMKAVLICLLLIDFGSSAVLAVPLSSETGSNTYSDTSAPEPFLYLPFNTPQGWRNPSSWFDHHFPRYNSHPLPVTDDQKACIANKLSYGEGRDIAVGPTLEFPQNHPVLGKKEHWYAAGVVGYWCTECGDGQGQYVYYDGHPGYDWGKGAGVVSRTPVFAAGSGTIIEAKCQSDGTETKPNPRAPEGCSITIRHDSPNDLYTTHYFHLYDPTTSGAAVPWPGQNGVPRVGEHVDPSQQIAWVGGTCWKAKGQKCSWSPHLHFEVRHNGHPVDPWGWTPYVQDPGDPDADPLQCYQAEKSYNLFVGYEPHCYGCALPLSHKSAISEVKPFLMTVDVLPPTDYLGGVMYIDDLVSDSATFVADITIPDDTVVTPGQALHKVWRVRNTGTSTWNSNYQLVFTGGDQMGAPSAVNVPGTVSPGAEVDLSVPMTAPMEPGAHRGDWRLRNAQGVFFGDGLWVIVQIPDDGAPTPPPPPSGSSIALTCLDCPATVEPGQTFRPTIRATVNSGQLLRSRGDLLRNTDGNLYGAWPHIAVEHDVNTDGTYDFTFYADDPLRAPDQEGTYETKWRVWRDGHWEGDEITIRFTVQQAAGTNYPPNPPDLTAPGDWAIFQGNPVILTAQHNGDPDGDAITGYYFELMGPNPGNSGWIGSNTWNPTGLPYSNYEWRVKVRDSRGAESGWSPQPHDLPRCLGWAGKDLFLRQNQRRHAAVAGQHGDRRLGQRGMAHHQRARRAGIPLPGGLGSPAEYTQPGMGDRHAPRPALCPPRRGLGECSLPGHYLLAAGGASPQ